jgi:hypothetical protein
MCASLGISCLFSSPVIDPVRLLSAHHLRPKKEIKPSYVAARRSAQRHAWSAVATGIKRGNVEYVSKVYRRCGLRVIEDIICSYF